MGWLHRLIRWVLIAALGVLALDIGDNLVLRVRIHFQWRPYRSVVVKRYLAIRQKGQKTEFVAQEPERRQCSQTLLPQLGYQPCWLVERNPIERTDM